MTDKLEGHRVARLYFSVDRRTFDDALQLAINDGNGGYRLAGPKYDGDGKELLRHYIYEPEAQVIRCYLDRAFPSASKARIEELEKALGRADKILQGVSRAVEALSREQIQLDDDGEVVGVSRQAADEVANAVEEAAKVIRAALSKEGGK